MTTTTKATKLRKILRAERRRSDVAKIIRTGRTLSFSQAAATRRRCMSTRDDLHEQIDRLLRTAETGAEFAEVCRLETLLNGGPWFAS